MNTLILILWVLSFMAVMTKGIDIAISAGGCRKSRISMYFCVGAAILNIILSPFVVIEEMLPFNYGIIIVTTILILSRKVNEA